MNLFLKKSLLLLSGFFYFQEAVEEYRAKRDITVNGRNCPKPCQTFEECGLPGTLGLIFIQFKTANWLEMVIMDITMSTFNRCYINDFLTHLLFRLCC